jgi:hypothetical protein
MQLQRALNRIVRYASLVFLFVFLTILTQIGGVIYFMSLLTHELINKKVSHRILRSCIKFLSFLLLYLAFTFLLVPIISKPFGRVPLPIVETGHLKPLNFITCLLNRHYVRPALRQVSMEVAAEMNDRFPGTVVSYLDAGFPFINRFPLVPHLSHYDGKKLDLAFYYIDKRTMQPSNKTPSCIGYGIGEEPRPNEINTAAFCAEQGHWQYSFLNNLIPQRNKRNFIFDSVRTKALVNFFASKEVISKIFIEPHLKNRLKLQSDKIRFHGCQAVRHDDHLHIQIR